MIGLFGDTYDDGFVWQYSFNSMGCVELNGGMIVDDELEVM
jgi:hypothetical protein